MKQFDSEAMKLLVKGILVMTSIIWWAVPIITFAVVRVPGVVPNPPPLFELDAGVRPNLSGSIQSSGRAVLPGEEGSVDVDKLEDAQVDPNQVQTSQELVATTRGTNIIWWLAILVIGVLSYFGYKRWRLMR